jgi:hypothetical protein
MGYQEVIDMPIRGFWVLNGHVQRIMAEKDLRAITVAEAVANPEHGETVREKLKAEMGSVVSVSPLVAELDRTGLEQLRRMR